MNIRVGTRGSKLALWQSEYVIAEMKKQHPEYTYEIVIIKTKGDRIQNVSLDKIGDKGLFVKEIETQLLEGSIDLAVHSMKDMPSSIPPGLTFSKSLKR
ncbi:MAG: hydroxymethylbilane synthase, partial [Hungatella sp.]